MQNNLKTLVEKGKMGDMDSISVIFEKFELLIRKYERLLGDEDSRGEFNEKLLKTIYQMPELELEGQIVNYIVVTMNNHYIKLSKSKRRCEHTFIYNYDMNDMKSTYEVNIEDNIVLKEALSRISDKKRQVIELHYYRQYSISDIAAQMNVSRQAVNKLKNSALIELKSIINEK